MKTLFDIVILVLALAPVLVLLCSAERTPSSPREWWEVGRDFLTNVFAVAVIGFLFWLLIGQFANG